MSSVTRARSLTTDTPMGKRAPVSGRRETPSRSIIRRTMAFLLTA